MIIPELFEKIGKERSRKKKTELLHDNDCPQLRGLLKYIFHPDVKWVVPNCPPPFNRKDDRTEENKTGLFDNLAKLKQFVVTGARRNVSRVSIESNFIRFLESLDGKDADFVIMLIEKRRPKGVTENLIFEAFPELLPKSE